MEIDNRKEFIYEGKTNAIYSDGLYYYLVHRKTGKKWKFDRDERVLAGLIRFLDTNGSFTSTGRNMKSKVLISQVMWDLYYPYTERQDRRVMFAYDNSCNLTSANLYLRGDCVPAIQNRRIWHNDKRIFIRCLLHERYFFTDYERELYDLLCCTLFTGWYIKDPKSDNNYRLIAMCSNKRINLSEIVYGYYNFGLRVNNIVKVLPKIKKLASKGLEIDHLCNNPRNNTIHNLMLMPQKINARKNDMVARINKPFWFIPVQKDGKIRISLGDTATSGSEQFIMCDSPKDFVDLLYRYQRECFLSGRMMNRSIEGESRCISQTLIDDGNLVQGKKKNTIEILLGMSEDQFTKAA